MNGDHASESPVKSARAIVTDRLRREILSGELLPGTRLLQNQIAQRMQTSSTPVREAFGALAAEGLIDLNARRGATVHELSQAELLELQTIRANLESLSARLAIENESDGEFRELSATLAKMDQTRDADDWIRLNAEFHGGINRIARQPLLTSILTMLRRRARLYLANAILYSSDHMSLANEEHRVILDACQRGDVETVESVMHAHFMNSRAAQLWSSTVAETHPSLRS